MKALSLSLPTVSLPTAVTIISTSTSLLSPHAHPGSFPTLPHCQYHCCYGVVGFGGPIPSPTSQRVDCLATCFWANCERAVGGAAGWVDKARPRTQRSTAPQHEFSERRGSHLGRWAPNTFYKYKKKCSTRTSVLGSGAVGRGGAQRGTGRCQPQTAVGLPTKNKQVKLDMHSYRPAPLRTLPLEKNTSLGGG